MERIAIIGTGISSLGCAHFLHRRYDLTLFEAGSFSAPPLLAIFSASVVQPVIECIRPASVWVGGIFLVVGVLEHAPPATA